MEVSFDVLKTRMLALKIRDPIVHLKYDPYLIDIFVCQSYNAVAICPCYLTDLACTIDSDTHWLRTLYTSLRQCEMELILFVIPRQSALFTCLEHDCGTSGAFLNAFDN